MKIKRLAAFLLICVMFANLGISVWAVEENVNLFPEGATELNACWPSVGAGNTMESVLFEGQTMTSITANHTASLGADATVFARRDNTGDYAMECMRNGEHPLEFNREYEFSAWVKTSSTKLKDLKIKWTYFYGDKAAVEAYPDKVMELEETTDWQKISTTFKVAKLQDASGKPDELNFELLTVSGLTLDVGEKFSITFHDFSLVKLPEKVIVQEPYGNLFIDELTEGTVALGQGSNATTAEISLADDSFDGSERKSILITHKADTDNAIGMCHMASTLTMPTTLTMDKLPLENGKSYYVSMWIKTNEPAKIGSLHPYIRMYHDQDTIVPHGYSAYMMESSVMPLRETTDWQYISTKFTMNDEKLDQVVAAGGKPLHFYFNFLSKSTFEASEADPVLIALDRLSLREVPPADEMRASLIAVLPDENSGLADSNEEITFEFDNKINPYAITESNVFVNGEAQSKDTVDLMVEESKITILPRNFWKNGMEYTVEVKGLVDPWGRETSGDAEVNFRVKDFLDVTTVFKKMDENNVKATIDKVSAGRIYAECNVESNASQNKIVIMLLALCKGETIKKIVASETKTLASGENWDFGADIEVPAEDGYYLRVFIWDSLTSHMGLADIVELR